MSDIILLLLFMYVLLLIYIRITDVFRGFYDTYEAYFGTHFDCFPAFVTMYELVWGLQKCFTEEQRTLSSN